jgi:hypothetical protein
MQRGFITIAIGKKYALQAKYLALSAILHVPHIARAVVTDCPEILDSYYDFVIPYKSEYGNPFALKLRAHLYSPFEQTLFLDADTLIMNNIDSYWDALKSRSFAYRGFMATSGEWYFNIEEIIKQFDISWIPLFNSGMFLFDKSDEAKRIFDAAFDYMQNGNLNIAFFRGTMLPDEPFFALSLAKNDEKPYEEENERFSRALADAKDIHIDVIKGISYLRSAKGKYAFPLVIHFFGRFGRFLFWREKIKLFFYFSSPLTALLTNIFSIMRIFKKNE